MKLKPCCEPFGVLLSNAGEKGIAVVPRIRDKSRTFSLQARPFEPNIVSVLSEIDPVTGRNKWPSLEQVTGQVTSFVTVLTLPLKFCPACGKDLQAVIDQDPSAFDEDAKYSEHLWRE